MKHSESIANIAAALVAAQADIRGVGKDSTNPHFKSKYASLDSIIDMTRPALAKHGLAVLQGATVPESDENGILRGFTVETLLVHKSGEWISNGLPLPIQKADPQGAMAALTYGRRGSLSALLSISTDEDDDGNHASVPTARAHEPAKPSAAAVEAKNAANRNGNPADKLMPIGKQKGKKLGELTNDELESAIAWCNKTDGEKFATLVETMGQVLEDRLVAAALTDTPDSLPF